MNPNSNVSLFNFKGHEVRVVEIDGEPWFVAADVCKALDYRRNQRGIVNVTDALSTIDRTEISIASPDTFPGRGRPPKIITESGLYKLVMRSDKPEAKAFQDWVAREVLPSIRKHGGYILGQENMTTDQWLRAVVKIVGRKVASVPKNGALHLTRPGNYQPIKEPAY